MRGVFLGGCSAVVLLLACKSDGAPPPGRPAAQESPVAAAAPETPAACQQDSDCALTRVPEGACCPRLCTPRAVPVPEARALDEAVARCEQEGRPCPLPSCRAAMSFEVGCAAGKCVARRIDDR